MYLEKMVSDAEKLNAYDSRKRIVDWLAEESRRDENLAKGIESGHRTVMGVYDYVVEEVKRKYSTPECRGSVCVSDTDVYAMAKEACIDAKPELTEEEKAEEERKEAEERKKRDEEYVEECAKAVKEGERKAKEAQAKPAENASKAEPKPKAKPKKAGKKTDDSDDEQLSLFDMLAEEYE